MNEERELVRRAIGHDHKAFAELYDRFVNKIYKYVYYKVGAIALAEDLTAQTFLKAWENIGAYRDTGRPFAAWLYPIAHNLMVDHFRAQRVTLRLEDAENDAHAPDLVASVEQKLNADELRRALAKLTDDQQHVILLKFIEGYTTEQVAEMLDKNAGAIRALQHRALQALQRILKI
ncbi:MAG: sigma-70 family RNA polymerase sigma factor [Chloroflexi bacterium]|nr:sigma-70 family RNA polymerase sigma factor [Chloroflexota bacterium]